MTTDTDRGTIRRARARGRRPLYGVLLLTACVVLGSCSLAKKTRRMFGGRVLIEVAVDPRLNEDFPVEVDLVVVYDRDLLKELQNLDAETWFDKEKEQYVNGFEKALDLHHWEWVPDRPVEPLSVSHRLGARAGVVFARYFADGDHRLTVEPFKHFHLALGETEFEVGPLKGRKALAEMEKDKKKREKQARKQAKKERKEEKRKEKEAEKEKKEDDASSP